MSAVPLALATTAVAAAVADVTERALRAWQARWGLEHVPVALEASPWDANELPSALEAGCWLQAPGARPAALFWPECVERVLLAALFDDAHDQPKQEDGRLARDAACRVGRQLQLVLADAWQTETPFDLASPPQSISRWLAPVRVDILLGGAHRMVAIVPASHGVAKTRASEPAVKLRLDLEAFHGLPAQVQLRVGKAEINVVEAAALQVGDVIVLESLVHDPVELLVHGGATVLRAYLGSADGQRAVQLLSFSPSRESP